MTALVATTYVNWKDMGAVLGLSLAFGVGVVVVFTMGMIAMSRSTGGQGTGSKTIGWVLAAVLCFAVVAGVVVFAIYEIFNKG